MSKVYDILIIGGGPAGYTAALYGARSGFATAVLEKLSPGGQMATTSDVENYPGFPGVVDGFELGERMQEGAEKAGAETFFAEVSKVDLLADPKVVETSEGTFLGRTVILATGAHPRKLGIPQEEALVNRGVAYCATCDGAFYRDVPVCVVGGGDSACEEAMFLTRFASRVYLIHRRDTLRASKIMAERTLSNEKIFPMWNSTIVSYKTDDKGELEAVMLKDVVEGDETELPVKCVFMAIGHTPNTSFLGDLVDRDDAGYIIRKTGMMATRTPGLFAAGDVADPHYRQAISSAGMGCSAAIEAERYLLGL